MVFGGIPLRHHTVVISTQGCPSDFTFLAVDRCRWHSQWQFQKATVDGFRPR